MNRAPPQVTQQWKLGPAWVPSARIDRVHAETITMSERFDRALRPNASFVLSFELDRSLRYRFRLLDHPSQHRNDSFQVTPANPIRFWIDRIERNSTS